MSESAADIPFGNLLNRWFLSPRNMPSRPDDLPRSRRRGRQRKGNPITTWELRGLIEDACLHVPNHRHPDCDLEPLPNEENERSQALRFRAAREWSQVPSLHKAIGKSAAYINRLERAGENNRQPDKRPRKTGRRVRRNTTGTRSMLRITTQMYPLIRRLCRAMKVDPRWVLFGQTIALKRGAAPDDPTSWKWIVPDRLKWMARDWIQNGEMDAAARNPILENRKATALKEREIGDDPDQECGTTW